MKLFFESYNGLVTLGATMNFGRRCNGLNKQLTFFERRLVILFILM